MRTLISIHQLTTKNFFYYSEKIQCRELYRFEQSLFRSVKRGLQLYLATKNPHQINLIMYNKHQATVRPILESAVFKTSRFEVLVYNVIIMILSRDLVYLYKEKF